MSRAPVGFDALGHCKRLKDAGITDIQARIQAEALQHAELQARELHEAICPKKMESDWGGPGGIIPPGRRRQKQNRFAEGEQKSQ